MLDNNLLSLFKYYKGLDHKSDVESFITIFTIGNPGWGIKALFQNNEFKEKTFSKIRIDRTEVDWIRCYIEDFIFNGVGGNFNLIEIISIFNEFYLPRNSEIKNTITNEDDSLFFWLMKWFDSNCDGYWEDNYGISMKTKGNSWNVLINLEETNLENKQFKEINVKNEEEDWLTCRIENQRFLASCSLLNLFEVIKIFKELADH